MSLVLADGWLGAASFSTVVADLSGWVTSSICAPGRKSRMIVKTAVNQHMDQRYFSPVVTHHGLFLSFVRDVNTALWFIFKKGTPNECM
jgi:hypothetical protein